MFHGLAILRLMQLVTVNFEWDASIGADQYNLKTSQSKAGPWAIAATTGTPSGNLSLAGDAVTYVTVTARNVSGESPNANILPNINTVDIVGVHRYFVSGVPLPKPVLADVNEDGTVNTIDVVACQRFFLGRTTGIAAVGRPRTAGMLGDVL